MSREPSRLPVSKFEFEFERRKLTKDDVREMIYREVQSYRSILCYGLADKSISLKITFLFSESKQILEYHPQMLQEYIRGGEQISFLYPR